MRYKGEPMTREGEVKQRRKPSQKYSITNEKKLAKMFKEATGRVRNEIIVLFYTGMHVSVYCEPHEFETVWDGGVLSWMRRKKGMGRPALVRIPVPKAGFPMFVSKREVERAIQEWLNMPQWDRVSRYTVFRDMKKFGKKYGFDGNKQTFLSPANGRHTFCLWDLNAERGNVMAVKADMKCSLEMIYENYGLMDERRYG